MNFFSVVRSRDRMSKSAHYTHKCYMSNWAGTHKSHTGSRGNGQHMWTFFTAGARYERHVRARPLALTRRDAIANPHMDGTTRVCPDTTGHNKPVSCPHHVCSFATTERPGERGQTSELEGVRGWLALWNAALPLLTGAPRLVTGCRTAARIRMRRCYGRG